MDRDEAQAVRLYQQAAERGLARAQYCLGRCCEEGRGVKKDLKRAQALYQQTGSACCQASPRRSAASWPASWTAWRRMWTPPWRSGTENPHSQSTEALERVKKSGRRWWQRK